MKIYGPDAIKCDNVDRRWDLFPEEVERAAETHLGEW